QSGRGLKVSTFHTFGLNLLRREVDAAGLRPGFSLFDPEDAGTVLKEHLREHDLADAVTPAAALARISRWKNELIDPVRAAGTADDDFEAMLADLYGRYQQSLTAYNACDFDDLITRPVRLLRDDRDARERWQNRIRHLLVDEYQDTNGAQYELVRLLVGPRGAFTVVGDDDQSIYAWRGARPDNLARLRDHYPTLRVVMLEQNYRSSGRILKLANGLIGHNPHLFDKRLWCDLGPGEPARVLVCRDEAHEAERVAAEIQHTHLTKDRPYGSIAILYRSNHQARPFEQALRALSVPYFLSGGTSFFARAEVKDVMAYLRLLANPADDAAFLRVVNVPRREIGPTTLQRLAAFAAEGEQPLAAACADPLLGEHLPKRQLGRLAELAGLLAEQRTQAQAAANPVAAVRTLVERIDYAGWCRDNAPSRAAAERRMDNVADLLNWLERLHRDAAADAAKDAGSVAGTRLSDLVARLTLLDVLERQDEAEGGERVHLMTLHAAKGLEFPHVYLVGMEEELLPHRSSLEDAEDAAARPETMADTDMGNRVDSGADNGAGHTAIQEERRLCYVGITRARQSLTFTRARRRRRYGETVTCAPSRFLAELPAAELHQPDSTQRSDAEARAHGSAQLAALKGLFTDH
ncbi:MAG: UvrD-helicase domain-containing protein, partial [Gammaproteobacteria bacterium]|nr:UvrD-helicase domain-containing protein [Gammaproteobacteria bacterium]